MRIDALNQVSQLYQTSKPKKVLKNKENDTSDKFEISQSAKDYQTAKTLTAQAKVKTSSDIREEKVAELKEAVTSGAYNVSAAEIADKMIGKYFDSIF